MRSQVTVDGAKEYEQFLSRLIVASVSRNRVEKLVRFLLTEVMSAFGKMA